MCSIHTLRICPLFTNDKYNCNVVVFSIGVITWIAMCTICTFRFLFTVIPHLPSFSILHVCLRQCKVKTNIYRDVWAKKNSSSDLKNRFIWIKESICILLGFFFHIEIACWPRYCKKTNMKSRWLIRNLLYSSTYLVVYDLA